MEAQSSVKLFLQDTTLCAIVRDEMISPAQLPGKSGIRSFVESHVPHVEQAVIVDTGSVDGTRQELEQLASEFPNLEVRDHPFVNYVESRNFSIDGIRTPYTLVLDCDELIVESGIDKISEMLPLGANKIGICFGFENVLSNGNREVGNGHGIRFFKSGVIYYGSDDGQLWEFPYINGRQLERYDGRVANTTVPIFHFRPDERACKKKSDEWYYKGRDCSGNRDFSRSPTACASFKEWKQPNPFRAVYR
jgi:glycosyltransferase involved in cell wall biosynthesis